MPNDGPTMEQQYDGMGKADIKRDSDWVPPNKQSLSKSSATNDKNLASSNHDGSQGDFGYEGESSIEHVRGQVQNAAFTNTSLNQNIPASRTWTSFHKVPNPSLKLYVMPHLAGADELPVPGYTTEFNAYDHDHFALPNDN